VPESGLVVEQHYRKEERKRIETRFLNENHVPYFNVFSDDEVDREHHTSAIAPNIIHSLDAAVMMTTVNRAKRAGVDCIATVHDCYSTHAADAETLNEQLRMAFIDLFAHQDVLDCIEADLRTGCPAGASSVPKPTLGNLDIAEVI